MSKLPGPAGCPGTAGLRAPRFSAPPAPVLSEHVLGWGPRVANPHAVPGSWHLCLGAGGRVAANLYLLPWGSSSPGVGTCLSQHRSTGLGRARAQSQGSGNMTGAARRGCQLPIFEILGLLCRCLRPAPPMEAQASDQGDHSSTCGPLPDRPVIPEDLTPGGWGASLVPSPCLIRNVS